LWQHTLIGQAQAPGESLRACHTVFGAYFEALVGSIAQFQVIGIKPQHLWRAKKIRRVEQGSPGAVEDREKLHPPRAQAKVGLHSQCGRLALPQV
jgi:hypothetical protein